MNYDVVTVGTPDSPLEIGDWFANGMIVEIIGPRTFRINTEPKALYAFHGTMKIRRPRAEPEQESETGGKVKREAIGPCDVCGRELFTDARFPGRQFVKFSSKAHTHEEAEGERSQ